MNQTLRSCCAAMHLQPPYCLPCLCAVLFDTLLQIHTADPSGTSCCQYFTECSPSCHGLVSLPCWTVVQLDYGAALQYMYSLHTQQPLCSCCAAMHLKQPYCLFCRRAHRMCRTVLCNTFLQTYAFHSAHPPAMDWSACHAAVRSTLSGSLPLLDASSAGSAGASGERYTQGRTAGGGGGQESAGSAERQDGGTVLERHYCSILLCTGGAAVTHVQLQVSTASPPAAAASHALPSDYPKYVHVT
jgi:hypothetical protein